MKSANHFAGLVLFASLFVTGSALAQEDTRGALLIKRDFSDCSNSDVSRSDTAVGGYLTVDRGADGTTHVRVDMLGKPNTTYHLFLKCVQLIGDITTQAEGYAIANFDFPTNWAGDVFAFDMYPEGAPLGDKYQSVRVDFSQRPPANSSISFLPADQQVSRRVTIVPPQAYSADCTNADLRSPDQLVSGGDATVDRGADGITHVRVRLMADVGTTFHVFLKCVRQLGDVTMKGQGEGVGNFDFRTNEAGDVFAFEVYSEGAADADKWQSARVVFGEVPPPDPDQPPVVGTSPRIIYVDQTGRTVRFAYANMPAGTQIVGVAWASNFKMEPATFEVSQGGDGSAVINFPASSEGLYYLLAQRKNDGAYLAQTIDFYVYPPGG